MYEHEHQKNGGRFARHRALHLVSADVRPDDSDNYDPDDYKGRIHGICAGIGNSGGEKRKQSDSAALCRNQTDDRGG